MLTPLESLKIKVQETHNETYTDQELNNFLEDNDNNVLKTAYVICMLKSRIDADGEEKKIKVGPIEIENNVEDNMTSYWKTLANMYLKEYKNSSGSYITQMRRADGC